MGLCASGTRDSMTFMNPPIYHIIHIIGLTILFAGFGGMLGSDPATRRRAMMFHGIGLMVMLFAAFGFLASYNRGAPGAYSYSSPFVMAKGAIWLVMAVLPMLAKKNILSPTVMVLVAVVLAGCAEYIGLLKPLAIK